MDKSPDAFRTISEVAEALDVPAHVLRFWESRFPQIKPVKRAGGRRYYRRADIDLLAGIRQLLHEDGMTIRGVQKLLREQGIRAVAGRAPHANVLDWDSGDAFDGTAAEAPMAADVPLGEASEKVVPFRSGPRRAEAAPPAAPEEAPAVAAAPIQPDLPGFTAELPAEVPQAGPVPVDTHTQILQAEPEPAGTAEPAPRPAWLDLPADPEDDDPAFVQPPLALHRLPRDAGAARPVYERLVALRQRLGPSTRRQPPI